MLRIKSGKALNSILALGGAGTLVFTLALQDMAQKALCGLLLAASNAFAVGDYVVLGDKKEQMCGYVTNIGWLNSEIRGKTQKDACLISHFICLQLT